MLTRKTRQIPRPRKFSLEKTRLFCETQTRAARTDVNIRLALAEIAVARAKMLLRRTDKDVAPYEIRPRVTESEPRAYKANDYLQREPEDH